MAATHARRRAGRVPLVEGHRMRCPRCRRLFDIVTYVRLMQAEEFMEETAPVYKCPRTLGGCGFIFAPTDDPVVQAAAFQTT